MSDNSGFTVYEWIDSKGDTHHITADKWAKRLGEHQLAYRINPDNIKYIPRIIPKHKEWYVEAWMRVKYAWLVLRYGSGYFD